MRKWAVLAIALTTLVLADDAPRFDVSKPVGIAPTTKPVPFRASFADPTAEHSTKSAAE